MRQKKFLFVFIVVSAILLSACGNKDEDDQLAIAVFVPGVLEGSPTYEMMDTGVRRATGSADVTVKTIEGGFDQATWSSQIIALASEGRYDLIVTSNPAMSEICEAASEAYPAQEFLVLDGSGLGGDQVTDVIYDHLEQAFLVGYFAGLVTASDELPEANPDLKVGMIVGQEYPQMNREIRPGFEIGLQTANPDIDLEFRVLGNWYDAEKARELAGGLYAAGADVILTIAGGANEGVIAAARETGNYVLWFDSEGTSYAPGTVLGSAVIGQARAAEEWVTDWISGNLEIGADSKVGVVEGYVDFPLDTRDVKRYVPESILDAMADILQRMRSGSLDLSILEN